jgi:site-specific DNA-methyltransferase (adenine-specific)
MSTQSLAFVEEASFANPISDDELGQAGIHVHYKHPNGLLYEGDSIAWLRLVEERSVDLIFADPPYNLNKAEWDNFESQEQYIKWSLQWIEQAARILKPTGSMYICGFSEILADIKHSPS